MADRPHPMVTVEEQLAEIADDQSRGALSFEEAEARRRMARAGVEGPQTCQCGADQWIYDEDFDRRRCRACAKWEPR